MFIPCMLIRVEGSFIFLGKAIRLCLGRDYFDFPGIVEF